MIRNPAQDRRAENTARSFPQLPANGHANHEGGMDARSSASQRMRCAGVKNFFAYLDTVLAALWQV